MSEKFKDVQFVQITTDQLAELIDNKLNNKLENLKRELLAKGANDELLTRKQAAKFLNIDISTLHLWVKKGKVPSFGIGHRRYFKRSQLVESLIPLKSEDNE